MMRGLVVGVGLLVLLARGMAQPSVQASRASCVLDSEAYQRDARALAARMPSGKLERPDGYTASFDHPTFGRVSVTIGGCAHLGLEVLARMPAKQALSRAAALQLAQRLTADYLVPAFGKDLLQVLSQAPSAVRGDPLATTLLFTNPRYLEFAVTYGVQHGVLTVQVSAIPDT